MSYVLKTSDGAYRAGRKGRKTEDLQQARIYRRKVDALNSWAGGCTILPVRVVLEEEGTDSGT